MKPKPRPLDSIVPPNLRRLCRKGYLFRRLQHCRLPPLFPGTTLPELDLSPRPRKFFERAGYVERPEAVAQLTIGDLAKAPGLGARSILEIVEALRRCAQRRGFNDREPLRPRDARSPMPEVAPRDLRRRCKRTSHIPAELYDCRLPPIPPAATLADLRLKGRALRCFQQGNYIKDQGALARLSIAELLRRPGIGAVTVVEIVEALYDCSEPEVAGRTLDEEVLLWLAPSGQPQRRRIIAERLGLGGRPVRSLAALGASYGCSGEWIRQMAAPRSAPPAAVLRRFQAADEIVSAFVPVLADAAEAKLAEKNLIGKGTKLDALLRVARLLDCRPGFTVQGKGQGRRAVSTPTETVKRLQALLVRMAQASPVMQTMHLLSHWKDSAQAPPALAAVEQAVGSEARAHWLHRASGWFWLDHRGAALRRRIETALAAAEQLTIAELQLAAWRGPRTKDWPRPPLAVFRELCRQLPECRIQNDLVQAADPLRAGARLRGDEKRLIEFLQRCGRPRSLHALRGFAASVEISEASLWQCLQSSSGIMRHGRGRYGLPGIRVGAELEPNRSRA